MNPINVFVNHRLAASLTMLVMILAGVWAVTNLNVGLNSPREMRWVSINIVWRSASAEDVEKLVTSPVELALKTLSHVKAVRSTTQDTRAWIQVEMESGSDMQKAADDIKQRIGQMQSLPIDIEPPIINL